LNRSKKVVVGSIGVAALTLALAGPAHADANKPGTHIKTVAGLTSSLESAGVVLYGKGGATSAVMGDSVASPNGQVVFHVPITSAKNTVKHVGSTLVLFNTTTNKQVELRNPVIDLSSGTVRAAVGTGPVTTVFTITNAKTLKPVAKKDPSSGIRTTMYDGVELSLAPGIAAAVVDGLGLPAGALVDGSRFATATVTLSAGS
jgi:hypothetical protein